MSIVREGRKTCIHCRKSLDNGQPLTDATVIVDQRWSTNSVGFTRVPVQPHQVLVAAHAVCQNESDIWFHKSKMSYAAEQLAELPNGERFDDTREHWRREFALHATAISALEEAVA